jgi:hypothetical protein
MAQPVVFFNRAWMNFIFQFFFFALRLIDTSDKSSLILQFRCNCGFNKKRHETKNIRYELKNGTQRLIYIGQVCQETAVLCAIMPDLATRHK